MCVSVQIAFHADLSEKGRVAKCEQPKHKFNNKERHHGHTTKSKRTEQAQLSWQQGGQQDREREERERQRREREKQGGGQQGGGQQGGGQQGGGQQGGGQQSGR